MPLRFSCTIMPELLLLVLTITFFSVHNIKTPVVVAYIAQGILGAVLGAVVGTRDPQQVNMLAKQAGEVCSRSR